MTDGSVRTLRAPALQFSVGDPVEVKDDALTLRDPSCARSRLARARAGPWRP